jgi:hypothetical protein
MTNNSNIINSLDLSDVNIQKPNINIIGHHNIHVNLAKIKFSKIFEILIGAFFINLIFATFSYFFLYNQISNATTFSDFFYFGIVSLTSTGYGDMLPTTRKAKMCVSLYLLLVFSVILSFTL